MKKITKIGVLSLALCGLLVALHASADPIVTVNKKLELRLKPRQDTCVMQDYDLGEFDVSESAIAIAKTGSSAVSCQLWTNPARNITLELKTGLTDSSQPHTIGLENFNYSFTNVTVNGSLGTGTEIHTYDDKTFANSADILYEKGQKKIGVWTGTLAIGGTIPAGTPAGSYTGELDLLVQ